MTKKIFILGVFSLLSGLTSAIAADPAPRPQTTPAFIDERFNCTFEGPAVVVKGAVPLVCTAFGQFDRPTTPGTPVLENDDHLTVICGNAVLYSDGIISTFPTNTTTELRSVVPFVTSIAIRTLTPGVFTGPLGSVLRIDIPGTPQALLTGVCHINPHVAPVPSEFSDLE